MDFGTILNRPDPSESPVPLQLRRCGASVVVTHVTNNAGLRGVECQKPKGFEQEQCLRLRRGLTRYLIQHLLVVESQW